MNVRTMSGRSYLSLFRHLLVAALAASISPATHANLIVNGDFESGTFVGWSADGALLNASDADYRIFAGATGTFASGFRVAAFGGGELPATGVLAQSFGTATGLTYRLTFDYGNYGPGCCGFPLEQVLGIQVRDVDTGVLLAGFDVVDSSGVLVLDSIMSPYALSFTAAGSSTRLVFADHSIGTRFTDGLLDNVSVEQARAVPEPASFWLALIGIAAAGWRLRKRGPNPHPLAA